MRPDEYAEAGRVTALAYAEFARPDDPHWHDYVAEIADVEGRADRTVVLVAVDDGRVLGSATIELEDRVDDDDAPLAPGEASLRMLGVDPALRRAGVGRRLVEATIERAREAGKSELTLRAGPRMKAAHAMYESMGFRRDERFDWDLENGVRLIGYSVPL